MFPATIFLALATLQSSSSNAAPIKAKSLATGAMAALIGASSIDGFSPVANAKPRQSNEESPNSLPRLKTALSGWKDDVGPSRELFDDIVEVIPAIPHACVLLHLAILDMYMLRLGILEKNEVTSFEKYMKCLQENNPRGRENDEVVEEEKK